MNDFISRQAAIAAIHELKMSVSGYDNDALDVSLIYEVLGEIPTADVQPIKRGHWIKRAIEEETPRYISFTPIWACSECGIEYSPAICQIIRYCPNCGAKMEMEDK